jgi:hypothetical protein
LDLDRFRGQVESLRGKIVEDLRLDADEQPLGAREVPPTGEIHRWVVTWDD